MSALLDIKTVTERTGLSKSTIYRMVKVGAFPKPIALSPRCSRWKSVDVESWVESLGVIA